MPPRGGKPKPLEERRRNGNVGHRKLPPVGSLIPLAAASEPPQPARALGPAGSAAWQRIWTAGAVWLAEKVDAETILIICEQTDERERLRLLVADDMAGAWRERNQLRALTKDILDALGGIGFNPAERTRMGVAEVQRKTHLDELMERRQGRQ